MKPNISIDWITSLR